MQHFTPIGVTTAEISVSLLKQPQKAYTTKRIAFVV